MGIMEKVNATFAGLIHLFEEYWWIVVVFILIVILYLTGVIDFIRGRI